MSNFTSSISHIIKKYEFPEVVDEYLIFKLHPIDSGCCCLRHWRSTWEIVDEHLQSNESIFGPSSQNENDILVNVGNEKYVLQSHESGPEIILYLGVAVVSINLINSIIDLFTTIIKSRSELAGIQSFYLTANDKDGKISKLEIFDQPNATNEISSFISSILIKKIHKNILALIERMEICLHTGDFGCVLHSSASIFETMAKDIVGITSIQKATLKSFFDRYRKDSNLPEPILDYILSIYDKRNTDPLAGHGSLSESTITPKEAVVMAELTKAIVYAEYLALKNNGKI